MKNAKEKRAYISLCENDFKGAGFVLREMWDDLESKFKKDEDGMIRIAIEERNF